MLVERGTDNSSPGPRRLSQSSGSVKTTVTSAVHRAEKVVSGAHSEQKPHNEQKSSGQNKNRNNWHILASRSGSRSTRNKKMLRAEMPP